MRRVLLLVCLFAFQALCAQTPFAVTNTADSGAGSLRAAITAANANGFSTIHFNLTLPATITINSALPRVVGDLNICGPSARLLTISGGGGGYRFLTVGDNTTGTQAGFLSIENLAITNFGGGAFEMIDTSTGSSSSSVIALRVAIRNCSSSAGGGAALTRPGSFVLQECEVSGCSATGGTSGGGIKMLAGTSWSQVLLICCTLQGNSATARGGAIDIGTGLSGSSSCSLINCTVADNTASTAGGGISAQSAICTLRNTIIANNAAAAGPDGAGAFTSNGWNLIQNVSGMTGTPGTGDQTGVNPQLMALADNGGQTNTMMLSMTSPALDAASMQGQGMGTDSRGVARPYDVSGVTNVDDGSDIGAIEYHPSSSGTSTVTCVPSDNMSAEATPSIDVGVFTFYCSPPPTATISLILYMNGSADFAPGADYFLAASVGVIGYGGGFYTLDIPPGNGTATLTVTPLDDSVVEGATPENVYMIMYPSFGAYTIGYASQPQLFITDNDVSGTPTVTVSATDSSASEAAAASDKGVYSIVLAPAPASAFTLNFTMSGTAAVASGGDYSLTVSPGTLAYSTGPAGTISVAAGTTSITLTLTVVDDPTIEGGTPETAICTLNSGSGYALGSTVNGTVSIVDNDVAPTPTITVSATDPGAAEATPAINTGAFTIVLSPAPAASLTISFTMSGTADTGPGVDYALSAAGGTLSYSGPGGTVTVGSGANTVTITLTAVDDVAVEGAMAETAVFTLNSGAGYNLGTAVSDTVSIAENDALPLMITTVNLPGGTAGTTYSQTVFSTGGLAPYSWSIISGNLPPGVSLGASTTGQVTISGTPTNVGTYNFTLQISDGTLSDSSPFTIVVAPSTFGGNGTGSGSGGSGCSTDDSSGWIILALTPLLFAWTLRRRGTRAWQ